MSGGQGGAATRLAVVVSLQPMYAYFEAAEQDYLKYMDLARSGARPLSRDAKNPVHMAVGNETEFKHQGYMDFVDNRVQTGHRHAAGSRRVSEPRPAPDAGHVRARAADRHGRPTRAC